MASEQGLFVLASVRGSDIMVDLVFITLFVLFVSISMTTYAEYKNRPHALAMERIEKIVQECLSKRIAVEPSVTFFAYDPTISVTPNVQCFIEQIAHVFDVAPEMLRPSDILGDLFYGTIKEGWNADVRYVVFFDELYEVILSWVNPFSARDSNSDISFLKTEDDALLGLSKMTIADLVKLVVTIGGAF